MPSQLSSGLEAFNLASVYTYGPPLCVTAVKILTTSKKECNDQESIQSSTKPDPGYQWESDNVTIRHHKREPRDQPFPSR